MLVLLGNFKSLKSSVLLTSFSYCCHTFLQMRDWCSIGNRVLFWLLNVACSIWSWITLTAIIVETLESWRKSRRRLRLVKFFLAKFIFHVFSIVLLVLVFFIYFSRLGFYSVVRFEVLIVAVSFLVVLYAGLYRRRWFERLAIRLFLLLP